MAAGAGQLCARGSCTFADSPSTVDPTNNSIATSDTLTHRFLLQLGEKRYEAVLFSPCFIPGTEAPARIGKLRSDDVAVRVDD